MKPKIRFSGIGLAGLIFLMVAFGSLYIAITQGNWVAGLFAVVMTYMGSDAMFFEIGYVWTNGGLKVYYEAWQRKRRWSDKDQLENLKNLVQGDHRWLAHVPLADALTERYLNALAPDWYTRVHEDSGKFRQRMNLDPNYKSVKWILLVYRKCDKDMLQTLYAVRRIPDYSSEQDRQAYATVQTHAIKTNACKKDRDNFFAEWSSQIVQENSLDMDVEFYPK